LSCFRIRNYLIQTIIMWKDFFYFSKGQRVGIIVLVALILIVLAVNYSLPLFFPATETAEPAFLAEVDAFRKTLVSRDSVRLADRQRQYDERQRQYEARYRQQFSYPPSAGSNYKVPYTLFPFDPNTVDSAELVRLGLKPYIASNILKYRKKGGTFRTIADFGKVYGITPEKMKELEPFVSIHEMKKAEVDSLKIKNIEIKKDIVVELNSADTTELMQVKGIGRSYAKGIIRLRNAMGGFVSVDQLNEIYGMRPENMEQIRSFCTVNFGLVQKIRVNTASAERLNRHPYLSFYQAKAIYELRRNRGKLRDINDLNMLSEMTPENIAKIKPYLSFE